MRSPIFSTTSLRYGSGCRWLEDGRPGVRYARAHELGSEQRIEKNDIALLADGISDNGCNLYPNSNCTIGSA